MKQKGNFKGRETIQSHFSEKEVEFGRLRREIGITVETSRPIFTNDNGEGETKGPKNVDIVFMRGRGRLAVTVEEAEWLYDQLRRAIPKGARAQKVVEEEREAWKEEQGWAAPPGSKDRPARRTGKTARKKKAGKAGEAFHRAKKAEKSQRSRAERRGGAAK